jgi:FPC/CPF motif-containing protein YcgG
MQTTLTEASPAELDADLRAFIADQKFPCVGAKSAAATGSLVTLIARDITSALDDTAIVCALKAWANRLGERREGLHSLAVIFNEPRTLGEAAFERAMWQRLQALADLDAADGEPLDPSVSADPENSEFAISFGGKAFFIVGLHGAATRPARRFAHPTLIFNLHAQFDALRERQIFDRMRAQIIKRDIDLAGSPNPMLAGHGERSAARQYSGRAVGDDWVCPFRDVRS